MTEPTARSTTDPAPGAGDEFSVATLVSDVAADVKRLLQQEVRLARSEIRGEVKKATSGGRLVATGAMALHLVVVLISVGAVFATSQLLADRVPDLAAYAPAIATGGVALVWLIIGLILLSAGRRRLRSFSPIPRQTIKTLKEDIAWLRKPTR